MYNGGETHNDFLWLPGLHRAQAQEGIGQVFGLWPTTLEEAQVLVFEEVDAASRSSPATYINQFARTLLQTRLGEARIASNYLRNNQLLLGGVIALIFIIGLSLGAGTVLSISADNSDPLIKEGDFTIPTPTRLLAVTGHTCSSDSDCPQTKCDGTSYYVDTDGSGECVYNEQDGEYQCGGYDKVYSGASICGGRYDYKCDSTGCEGYKAACEADCSANSGCDSYDFCAEDDDDSGSSGSSGSSKSDVCEEHTTKCDGTTVVQCQDTDGDGYTDGFEVIEACDGDCVNAACTPPLVTRWYPSEDGQTCTAAGVEDGTTTGYDTEASCLDALAGEEEPSLGERLDTAVFETLRSVWRSVTGLFS